MQIKSITGTILWEKHELANLRGADLRRANLRGADLWGADLRGADLRRADLQEANLQETDLWGADLWGADLWGADLREANLQEANLQEANLRGADLRGANLRGANLNWSSHELIARVLYQAAGQDTNKRAIAGLILISADWCWKDFLQINLPYRKWAIETLLPFSTTANPAPFTQPTFSKILAEILEEQI